MTALAGTWRRPVARTAVRVDRPVMPWFFFGAAMVGYVALGAYVGLVLHAMHGDAYSRVTNAYFAIFSRDPHLAAIGFVWPPLPTMVELALVPFRTVWPPLVNQGFAAVLMSSFFMAGAVYQVERALADFAVPRLPRYVLVLAFALHPMTVYYAAIGTSEAPTVFFMVLTARYLARWIATPTMGALVLAGVGLAGAYLTRYETIVSAAAAGGLVLIYTLGRSEGRWRARLDAAMADGAIVLAPVTLAFVAWAFASWLIVGTPFAQFTSQYGNSAQLGVAAAQGGAELGDPLLVKLALVLRRLGLVEIVLPSAIGMAALIAARRRDDRWLAVVAVMAPTLGFMVVAYLAGLVFPWLRFFILAVPLAILLLGLTIGGLARRDPTAGPQTATQRVAPPSRTRRWTGSVVRGLVVSALLLTALASSAVAGAAMLDRTIAVEEARDIGGLLGPDARSDDRRGADLRTFATERTVATYVDGLGLPRGSVLVDAFSGFAIVAQSAAPAQFVITPDIDFRAVLADPAAFGVRYILAPAATGNAVLDAVNVAYPDLAQNGAGIATLETRFEGRGGSYDWALYRVASP